MNKVRLRNKIVEFLNNSSLGCHVQSGRRDFSNLRRNLVWGVAQDGRAILIYPIGKKKTGDFCKGVSALMSEYEKRGAIVGCAASIGDAWDIVQDDESLNKRLPRTYYFVGTTMTKGNENDSDC